MRKSEVDVPKHLFQIYMKQYFDASISFRASEDNLPAQRESSTESSQYLSTGESVRESQHRQVGFPPSAAGKS